MISRIIHNLTRFSIIMSWKAKGKKIEFRFKILKTDSVLSSLKIRENFLCFCTLKNWEILLVLAVQRGKEISVIGCWLVPRQLTSQCYKTFCVHNLRIIRLSLFNLASLFSLICLWVRPALLANIRLGWKWKGLPRKNIYSFRIFVNYGRKFFLALGPGGCLLIKLAKFALGSQGTHPSVLHSYWDPTDLGHLPFFISRSPPREVILKIFHWAPRHSAWRHSILLRRVSQISPSCWVSWLQQVHLF